MTDSLILGIDLEGVNQNLVFDGIDLKTDRVIEIGTVLWDWSIHQPIRFTSHLIDEKDRLPINTELAELTGITEAMVERYGRRGDDILTILDALADRMDQAHYIMAHNGRGYDYPMLSKLFERHNKTMPDKLWIDSATDVEYPPKIKQRSMALLEHAHGFINPFPHRAVTDVLSMFKIVQNYDLKRMVRLAESPIVKITALFDPPNWKNQESINKFNKIKNRVAKSGFRWSPEEKTWSKKVHKILLDENKISYEFDFSASESLPPGASLR